MFWGLHNLNVEELLPEILDAINVCLKEAEKISSLLNQIKTAMPVANNIITTAFVKYSDKIKNDKHLTDAYEGILEALMRTGDEQAAWLLDEFRLH